MSVVVSATLRDEIQQAKRDLSAAWDEFSQAQGVFIDAASFKVMACEMRLNALYIEARNGGHVNA